MAHLIGLILLATGVIALVVTLVRGPNLNLSRRTGYISGIVLLLVGLALFIITN